jgi:NAD(P)-dependent dehydrogenase (short-subunit alcohol dehydrogenase family)
MTDVEHAPDCNPATLFRLDGRVAVITGASSGLGRRLAVTLHTAGAHVVLAARRVNRLEELGARLSASTVVECDVTNQHDLERVITTAEALGGIDVLVNNAGVNQATTADTESIDAFRSGLEVNLVAHFRLAQLAAAPMVARGGGSIINVASILGLVGGGRLKTEPSYSASKGAIVALTRELAAQWGARGVRVNAIAPGWFPTEMTNGLFDNDSGLQWIKRNTPMGRAGAINELDGVLLFLASDASSYVTGQTIAVDGGWTSI